MQTHANHMSWTFLLLKQQALLRTFTVSDEHADNNDSTTHSASLTITLLLFQGLFGARTAGQPSQRLASLVL